jgi:hypothetical protein
VVRLREHKTLIDPGDDLAETAYLDEPPVCAGKAIADNLVVISKVQAGTVCFAIHRLSSDPVGLHSAAPDHHFDNPGPGSEKAI